MKQLQTLSFGTNMQITESLKHGMSRARLPAGDSVFNPLDTPPVDTAQVSDKADLTCAGVQAKLWC